MTTAVLQSEETKIRHFVRRAGFCAGQSEMQQYLSLGLSGTTDYFLGYDTADDSALDQRLASMTIDPKNLTDIQRWWLVRMIYTKRPLLEKMVLFWHGILTSAISKVGSGTYMLAQNQLFRQQALGDYGVLLKAISRDTAMLIWLDSRSNVKTAPNENFARELMEIFTLGTGNYTETDVRESARAFTGWTINANGFFFDTLAHDSGIKTFLGQTGNFNGDDIIDIIMAQPAAGKFIGRKLFEFFAYANPSADVVTRLAGIFQSSNHSIKTVVKEILTSSEFYSADAYRANIKNPAELVAGTIRNLGMDTSGVEIVQPVTNMGQALFNPPDVSGWKGGLTWINSNTLVSRVNFANQVASARSASFMFNPLTMLTGNGIATAADAVNYFVSNLLDGNIGAVEKQILLNYVQGMTNIMMPTSTASSDTDEKLRTLAYLVMAMPEYQLA